MTIDYDGITFNNISDDIKQLVSNKLYSIKDDPNNYIFINGFMIIPMGYEFGQTLFNQQLVTVALLNTKTSELKFFTVQRLLEEIESKKLKENENLERCEVISFSDFKNLKVENDA